ncbi:nucleoside hydrolase [Leucobacter sp. HY1910]
MNRTFVMPRPFQIILDTDLGSDVDDAMALSVILGSDDIDLVAATTVYGDALLRARMVKRYAALAGVSVPTYVGESTPLSGRDVWWAGVEGTLHTGLETETPDQGSAVQKMVEAVNGRPGEIDIVAIGPLTNIASAIAASPQFAGNVRHLWIMGGSFDGGPGVDGTGIEHNLRSDDVAAARVFAAEIPTTVTGLEVTEQIEIAADQLDRIRQAGPVGAALGADIAQWWEYWNRDKNVPHDPITVLTMTRPELFTFSASGRVEIQVGGAGGGRSDFHADQAGTVRLVTGVNIPAVTEAIVSHIERLAQLNSK